MTTKRANKKPEKGSGNKLTAPRLQSRKKPLRAWYAAGRTRAVDARAQPRAFDLPFFIGTR